MKVAIFFNESNEFLESWANGGEWSRSPKDALLQDSNELESGIGDKCEVFGKQGTYVNPDDFRHLTYDVAVAELCRKLNYKNGYEVSTFLNILFGDGWSYEGDLVWLCNGRTMDFDKITKSINEANFSCDELCTMLEKLSDVKYWRDYEDGIFTSPSPNYDNFTKNFDDGLSLLESQAEFHLLDDGLKAEDSMLVAIRIALFNVRQLLNGVEECDIK